jgi:putative nucleotide binding protein
VETYAHILDYLPNGRATEHGFHREPVALAVGESELKLLELIPRPGIALSPGGRIPLVPLNGVAPPIDHVRRRLGYPELSTSARTLLPEALEKIVRADPGRFLKLFNEAPAVSRRFNLLELLPGIGKKTMLAIVEERRKGPFESFEALETRTHITRPERRVVARIEQEMEGAPDKYRLYVAP